MRVLMNDISPLCLRFERASERGGYPASGEFDQNGEFGKSDNLTTFRRKDLDFRLLAKEGGTGMRRIPRKWRIWRKRRFDDISAYI